MDPVNDPSLSVVCGSHATIRGIRVWIWIFEHSHVLTLKDDFGVYPACGLDSSEYIYIDSGGEQ
jgi:hypothetical protein